jgi:tRNA wybutosine-synthesizing protein 1
MSNDFRFEKDTLSGLYYGICGLGHSDYAPEHFNTASIELDKSLTQMKAMRIGPLGCADENTINSKNGSLEADVAVWQKQFFQSLNRYLNEPKTSETCCQQNKSKTSCCQSENNKTVNKCCKSNEEDDEGVVEGEGEGGETLYEDTTSEEEFDDADLIEQSDYSSNDSNDDEEEIKKKKKNKIKRNDNGLVDLEDLGKMINKTSKLKEGDGQVNPKRPTKKGQSATAKEMITPLLRKSLEKQGYKLIGSHSGVKLCRWTKSMLRGRGGCYKHTFYGIESHRCMETTPSLACANKCVFCWRHHT